jgi:hypothetical protein
VVEWCDELERKRPAVEAIASNDAGKRIAIEHTLVEPFIGEKEDTVAFRRVFLPLEINPTYRVPGYDIEIWPPVGAIPKGTNWQLLAAAVGRWFLDSARSFPDGDTVQAIPGLPLNLSVPIRKEPHAEGQVFVGRSGMPHTFEEVVGRAARKKIPKLLAASADVRLLLLEKDNLPRGYAEVSKLLDKLRASLPEIAMVDQVWVVNTLEWEKTGTVWFIKVWPDGVRARFTMREKRGEPESAIYVRGFGDGEIWREFGHLP